MSYKIIAWEAGDGRCRCKGGTENGRVLYEGPPADTLIEAYEAFIAPPHEYRRTTGWMIFIDRPDGSRSHLQSALREIGYVHKEKPKKEKHALGPAK
jgi:hypothetical protein